MKNILKVSLGLFGLILIAQISGAETSAPASLDLAHLAVPPTLGKIEEFHQASGQGWVVLIQDVHAHLTAQENISALIDHLNTSYGISQILLEGTWLSTSFATSWGLPNSQAKQMIARALLEDHFLTGPGYAALFSAQPILLKGAEDPATYKENLGFYLDFLNHESEIQKNLASVEGELQKQKQQTFNPGLLELDKKASLFSAGEKTEVFIPYLIKTAKENGLDFNTFPQTALFEKIMGRENSLSKDKLNEEAKRLMKEYQAKQLHFEELLKSGLIPEEKLSHYPASSQYLEILKLQEQLSHRAFFSEIEKLLELLSSKLAATEPEKKLWRSSLAFQTAKKIILLKATPQDLVQYETFKVETEDVLSPQPLSGDLKRGLQFYETAKKRDGIFFNKILEQKKNNQNVALVVGGFHSEGLTEELNKAGLSYIVISPDLGKDQADDAAYKRNLQLPIPETQTLAFFLRYTTPDFDSKDFPNSILGYQQSKNLNTAKDVAKGKDLLKPANKKSSRAAKKLSMDDLQNNPDVFVSNLLELQKGTQRISLIIKASDLKTLFQKNPLAAAVWKREIFSNKQNTVVLLYSSIDEIPDEAIGAQANVKKVAGSDLTIAAKKEAKHHPDPVAIIDSEVVQSRQEDQILYLPNRLAAPLTARAVLESGILDFAMINDLFFDLFEKALEQYYRTRSLFAKAA